MTITRRAMPASAFAAPLLRAAGTKLQVGITDWNLKLGTGPEAIPLAVRLGFDGV
jgi:hypothetical protein